MGLIRKIFGFDKPHSLSKSKVYRDIDKAKNINNSRKQKNINRVADAFNIYGGSRLPENPKELIQQGWNDTTHVKKKEKHMGGTYRNPRTKQVVDFDKGTCGSSGFKGKDHYHWHNPNSTKKKVDDRLDKYGRPCGKGSEASHILPKKGRKK